MWAKGGMVKGGEKEEAYGWEKRGRKKEGRLSVGKKGRDMVG